MVNEALSDLFFICEKQYYNEWVSSNGFDIYSTVMHDILLEEAEAFLFLLEKATGFICPEGPHELVRDFIGRV